MNFTLANTEVSDREKRLTMLGIADEAAMDENFILNILL